MDVFYKQNWASNVKLISFYMVYGWVFVSVRPWTLMTWTLTIHIPVEQAGEGYPTPGCTLGAPIIMHWLANNIDAF